MAINDFKKTKIIIIILKVKGQYLSCNDVKLKKYVGKKMAGEILNK